MPQRPNLLWTHSIEGAIENWHRTGVFPSSNMGLRSSYQFQGLSREDLRLVYHLLSTYQELQHANMAQCSLWVQELPRYLGHFLGHSREYHAKSGQ